ncbi:MAG: cyanobacterial phytochrome A, partial [Prochlorothrix sp.]
MTAITITAANVDLTNCAREQIHIPQSIQPHGALLVADRQLNVLATSANIADFFGLPADALTDRPLSQFLTASTLDRIQACLRGELRGINPIRVTLADRELNLIIHRTPNDEIILELEPIDPQHSSDFISFHHLTSTVVDEIQGSPDLQSLTEVIVRNIRQLTGFDRVMIYRFDADGSGCVIAEDKIETKESFLGLHYPATDIPEPARRLYCLNYIRLIPNIAYEAVALPNHPHTQAPF